MTFAERLAEVAVSVGANVQAGQVLTVSADIGHEEFVRAIAAAAYRRGAKYVDTSYFDPLLKRIRIEFADEDTLDFVPSFYRERVLKAGGCMRHASLSSGRSRWTRSPASTRNARAVTSSRCSRRC